MNGALFALRIYCKEAYEVFGQTRYNFQYYLDKGANCPNREKF